MNKVLTSYHVLAACLLVMLACWAVPAQAQLSQQEDSYAHRYARPGRATMTVYMWGQVGRSGIWQVEKDVDLVELLSAANVPGLGTEQPETRERYSLSVYRQEEGGGRRQIYENELEQVIEQSAEAPSLQEGDVLVLERRQERRWSFRTISQYMGTVSSIVLLLLRLEVI